MLNLTSHNTQKSHQDLTSEDCWMGILDQLSFDNISNGYYIQQSTPIFEDFKIILLIMH